MAHLKSVCRFRSGEKAMHPLTLFFVFCLSGFLGLLVWWLVPRGEPAPVALQQPAPTPPLQERTGIDAQVAATITRADLVHARPMLRQQLTEFVIAGKQIEEQCMNDKTPDADAYSYAEQWKIQVQVFLDKHMGTEYYNKFLKSELSPENPLIQPNSRAKRELWKLMHKKISLLNEFLAAVKD